MTSDRSGFVLVIRDETKVEWVGPPPEWVVVGAAVRAKDGREWTIASVGPSGVLVVDEDALQPSHWSVTDFLLAWEPVLKTRFEREVV